MSKAPVLSRKATVDVRRMIRKKLELEPDLFGTTKVEAELVKDHLMRAKITLPLGAVSYTIFADEPPLAGGHGSAPFMFGYFMAGALLCGLAQYTWNADGSISFIGRADDVITSAGYRIGPFDVESALIEHPSVAEVAVIGKPDPERTEIVKAFVVLRAGHAASPELAAELQQHVRSRLSAHAYPREVEFIDALPKTPSGKIQRFILGNREKPGAHGPDR